MQRILSLTAALIYCSLTYAQTPQLVKDISPSTFVSYTYLGQALGNQLLFRANDSVHGIEPWITDGTDTGTHLVKDINTIPVGGTGFGNTVFFNNRAYFACRPSLAIGWQFWESDGTDTGTHIAVAIKGSKGNGPVSLVVCNGKMFFSQYDSVHGDELWLSDGTEPGTHIVKDITPGIMGYSISRIVPAINKVYFNYNNEFWVSDGTDTGTHRIYYRNSSTPIYVPNMITECNGQVFFSAFDAVTKTELFIMDGPASAHMVKDINPLPANRVLLYFTAYNSKLYFVANTAKELWVSDGTDTGTRMLYDFSAGGITASFEYTSMTVYNNRMYFTASDSPGYEPWSTDGTTAGTKLLKRLATPAKGSKPVGWTVFNNKLYFVASTPAYGEQLWQTDGTADSTKMLFPSGTVNYDALYDGEPTLIPAGKSLYFAANYDSARGHELYRIVMPDTTPPVTHIPSTVSSFTSLTLYPNPTKDAITIQYTLTEAATPAYRLYDINGRCVASWLNESKLSAGRHSKQFNMANLPPASYRLQVDANGNTQNIAVIKQ